MANLLPEDNPIWLTSFGAAQTLFRVTPDLNVVPWIASAIEPNGQEGYTIRINPAARFHNGRQIDARTVQASIERHIARGVQVPSLKGMRWEIVDPLTLRVKTGEPDPWLPRYLAAGRDFPIFDVDELPERPDPASLLGKGYFSGPFRPVRHTPERTDMDAVPSAWDGAPRLAGVDVLYIKDPQARFLALKTGEIDMAIYMPAAAAPLIKQTPGLHWRTTPSPELVFVLMNHRRPPLNELPVRQAIALAIDRKQLAEKVLPGAYEPSDSLYPRNIPWTVPGVLRTDVAAARKLVDDAGWVPGADGIRTKDGKRLSFEWLHYPTQPDSKPMSEAVQAQLKAVGIEIRLKQEEDISAAFRSRNYDLGVSFVSIMLTAGNPMLILNTYFLADSPQNTGGWGSPELDKLIKAVRVEFDEQRRSQLMRQIQQVIARDVSITFTLNKLWSAAVSDGFADYVPGMEPSHYMVTKDTAPTQKR